MNTENKYLSTFQWFIYLLANSIALPIVIGNVYGLTEQEISAFMQRMFFIVGLSSFLQAKLGHRYPVADGPAGSWVSIFVIYASVGLQLGNSMKETLQILQAGLLCAGLVLFLLGITKWVRYLLVLFNPIVTGTFLFLLAIQLSGVFFNGMVSSRNSAEQLDLTSFTLALFVFFLILILNVKGKGILKSYAILIGILLGWVIFAAMGKGQSTVAHSADVIQLPQLFAWGMPAFNGGIMITAVLFTFLLLSNTVAAIKAAEEAIPQSRKSFQERLYSATWTGGISHFLSAAFSTIAAVPLPATAGFIKLTKQYRVLPFLSACVIMMLISIFPGIVGVLASLPMPVASAALLATLMEMLGIALRSLTREPLNNRNMTIIGCAILFGLGIMFLPSDTFTGMPNMIQSIFTNGLLIGTFIAMILDQLWKSE